MWTPATRKNYSRNGLRYQSDVTDEEWRVIEPYLPPAAPMGGRAVLCLDRPQQKACQRFRGQHRLRPRLPLRRFRHAALTPHRKARMSFETDS